MTPLAHGAGTVHLLCAVHNGERYLLDFLDSVQAQTYTDWQLWLFNDASRDGSAALLAAAAQADARVTVLPECDQPLGVVGAFAQLWAHVPATAPYIGFADQDDVWHPEKLARSLAALRAAEAAQAEVGPLLVHTDLEVVGAALEPWAPSFWRSAGIVPEPATLRRVVAQNVVTGCTTLMNRALYDLAGPIPLGVPMHDAWVAGVAALGGRIVAVPEATVRYRQHGANTLGARERVTAAPLWAQLRRGWRALTTHGAVRQQVAGAGVLAATLLARFERRCTPDQRDFLTACAVMPTLPWLARKRAVARLYCHPEHGWLRNAGVVWRA